MAEASGGEAGSASVPPPLRARTVLSEQPAGSMEAGRIHRFILGIESQPAVMADDEVARELNDPFASLLLRKGTFPTTVNAVLSALDAATAQGDPLRRQMSFLVGEGSQIPWSPETAALDRGFRLAIARGTDSAIDVLVSTDGGLQNGFLQVIGWDNQAGVFNYYEHREGAWIWAGNSTHAFDSRARGNGAFDSHINGSMVMKELKFPWNHWHSVAATIPPEAFAPDDLAKNDPLLVGRSGAEILQERVVQPGVRRWTDSRFAKAVAPDGKVAQVTSILEQILDTTSVNLVSASVESKLVDKATALNLPPTFFVDVDAFSGVLGLPAPSALAVSGENYLEAIDKFEVALVDGSFRRPGDTHFAFLAPERAFEDLDVVKKCHEVGLLSDRFLGCALMVDFSNPVFSRRRASLMTHVPDSFGGPTGGLADAIATAIVKAAASSTAASPESEFAELWNLGDGWQAEAARRLSAYYAALAPRLASADGFDQIFTLAESRRQQVLGLKLSEQRPLLFATSNISPASPHLEMHVDASIGPAS